MFLMFVSDRRWGACCILLDSPEACGDLNAIPPLPPKTFEIKLYTYVFRRFVYSTK